MMEHWKTMRLMLFLNVWTILSCRKLPRELPLRYKFIPVATMNNKEKIKGRCNALITPCRWKWSSPKWDNLSRTHHSAEMRLERISFAGIRVSCLKRLPALFAALICSASALSIHTVVLSKLLCLTIRSSSCFGVTPSMSIVPGTFMPQHKFWCGYPLYPCL